MTENKNCKQQDNKDMKLSALVDVDTINTVGIMSGECMVHRKTPEVNISDAYFLAAGETREIAAGKSFAIMNSSEMKKFEFEAYTALEPIKLVGPLVWSEIQAPETVTKRLGAIECKVLQGFDLYMLCLFFAANFLIINLLLILLMSFMDEGGKTFFTIASAMGLGVLVPFGLRWVIRSFKNTYLAVGTDVFIEKKEFMMSHDILLAISENKTAD